MAYSTATDVRVLLEGVTVTVKSDADIAILITDADNEINSKLASKYSVPFSTTPPIIKTLSKTIAAYYVMRDLFTNDSQNKNEWTDSYKDALRTLEKMSKGEYIVLDSSGAELAKSAEVLKSNHQDHHTTFDVDKPEDWSQDDDKLDAISDARD